MTEMTVTVKGKEVRFNSDFTNDEALRVIAKLAGNTFAENLCRQWKERNSLSNKQWAWVHRLATTSTGTKHYRLEGTMDNITSVVKEYEHKIYLVHGQEVQLVLATSKSKVKNSINVVDGKPFDKAKWFGRIRISGGVPVFEAGRDVTQDVLRFVQMFALDPMEIVISYETL